MQQRKYDYDLIIKMYREGKSLPKIAETVGCRSQQIPQILSEQGINRDRGKGSGGKKLTSKEVRKIYRLRFKQMENIQTIANNLNVSKSIISVICRGEIWKKEFEAYNKKP